MNGNRFRIPILVTVLTVTLLALVSPARAGTSSCSIVWGSLAKTADPGPYPGASIDDVRSGRHACYDRLVVDIAGVPAFGNYSVSYVDEVVGTSGLATPVRGGARLAVTFGASALTGQGTVAYVPADRSEVVPVAGYCTFRQVAWVESFEGTTILALGVRARLPLRVFVLDPAPGSGQDARLVIDVAHHW